MWKRHQVARKQLLHAGRLIGERESGVTVFLLTDELGSVHISLSAAAGSAAVLNTQVYSPYGTPRYKQGTVTTNKGFTGQYRDGSGLDYYNARYYDPVVGRFVSADTTQGNAQGMDPYSYVGNNSETRNDPTGRMFVPSGKGSGGTGDIGDSYCNQSGCYDGEGNKISGPPSSTPPGHPNPKARSGGTGGCDNECGKHDRTLLGLYYAKQLKHTQAAISAVGDIYSLTKDLMAGLVDALAQAWGPLILDLGSAVGHILALLGDLYNAGVTSIPKILGDMAGTIQTLLSGLQLVRGFLKFFSPGGWLKKSLILWHCVRQQQARVTAVRVKGMRTKGVISARYMGRFHWYLAFRYEDQGKEYMQRQSVFRTVYEKIHEGSVVDVAYIPENPQEAVLLDIDLWPFTRSLAIASTVLSVTFIMTVIIGGGFLLLLLLPRK